MFGYVLCVQLTMPPRSFCLHSSELLRLCYISKHQHPLGRDTFLFHVGFLYSFPFGMFVPTTASVHKFVEAA